jgi:hypothetical protein
MNGVSPYKVQSAARKEERLIAALTDGSAKTQEALAADTHMSSQTVARILRNPNVQERLAALHAEAVQEGVAKLRGLISKTVDGLIGLMSLKSETVRLRTYRTILEFGLPQVPIPDHTQSADHSPRLTDEELVGVFRRMGDTGWFAGEPEFELALAEFATEALSPEPDQRRVVEKRMAILKMALRARELREGAVQSPPLDPLRFGDYRSS